MTPVKPSRRNRYPGIRSFEKDDQPLFYGRSKEIEGLFNLIKIKSLIVLFGKSGLGKTSLLNAGVGPLLQNHRFRPILIRLQDTAISPVSSVLNVLEHFSDPALLEKYGGKTNNKIWEQLNACSLKDEADKSLTPVLIFDQFEELFNHPQKVQAEWIKHIADVIEGRLPEDIEGELNKIPRSQRTPEIMRWYCPPKVKVVFAIRSDRMSALHSLRFEIPAILQNRYELSPLQAQQARAAIEKPAALAGTEFTTLPFTYAAETIEKIQKELSNEQNEVESFQLQIICQHTELEVKKKQEEGQKNIIVTPDYLGAADGIKRILKNYYSTQITSLGNQEEQAAARKFLEEGLIMNRRRISVAEAVVKETYHINDDLLTKLLMSRLIRPENTRLGRTYEISHDTLVKPILGAYQKRMVKEKRLADFQKEREEEHQKQKKRRRRNLSILAFLLVALSLIAISGWVVAIGKTKTLENANTALISARDSLSNDKEKLEEANIRIQEVKDSFAEENLALLEKVSGLLSSSDSNEKETKVALQEINELKEEQAKTFAPSDQTPLNTQIKQVFSSSERRRTTAASQFIRKNKKDPQITAALIREANGKISKKYVNSIYQTLYILQQLDASTLQANAKGVQNYLSNIRKSGLVGTSTEVRMKKIERKLK